MAKFFQRDGSPYWYVWLKDPRAEDGLVKKSTKETSKSRAISEAKRLQDEIDAEVEAEMEARESACGLTFLDALELFLDGRDGKKSNDTGYVSQGKVIVQILGDFDLGQLTHDDLARFVRERRQMTVKPPKAKDTGRRVSDVRIRKDLSTISAVYKHVMNLDHPNAPRSNPAATFDRSKLKTSKIVDQHLRPNQFQEALDACKKPIHRTMLITLVGAGLRSSELLDLYWPEVDFIAEYIEFGNVDPERTKTTRSRRIPLLQVVKEELSAHKQRLIKLGLYNPNGLVFPNEETGERRYDLKYLIKIVRRRTRVKGYKNHGLRHTFASWCLQRGMDPDAIRRALGHTTLSTTNRYAHHIDDTMAARMRLIELPITAQSTAQSMAFSEAHLEEETN